MKQVCDITDSVACLTHEQAKKHKIEIVPMKILYNGIIYRDGIDLSSKGIQVSGKSPVHFLLHPQTRLTISTYLPKRQERAMTYMYHRFLAVEHYI